jgi:hypothetical protein
LAKTNFQYEKRQKELEKKKKKEEKLKRKAEKNNEPSADETVETDAPDEGPAAPDQPTA